MLSRHIGLVMRLPKGIQEQPGWVFIGTCCSFMGASYLLGVSQSTVTVHLDPLWLRVWGAVLSVAGVLVAYSTAKQNRPLERLSLRVLAAGLLVYMSWVLLAVPDRATMTVFLCLSLIVSSQIRVAVLGTFFERPLSPSRKE